MKFNWAQVNKQSLFLEHMSHNVVYWQKRWNLFFSVWYTLFQCDCQLRFVIHKVMHRLVCLCYRDEVERYIPINSCPSDEMSFTYMASGPSQPPNTFCDDCSSIGWDIFLLRFQLPGVFSSITNRKWKKKYTRTKSVTKNFGLVWSEHNFSFLFCSRQTLTAYWLLRWTSVTRNLPLFQLELNQKRTIVAFFVCLPTLSTPNRQIGRRFLASK